MARPDTSGSDAAAIIELCTQRGWTLAVAESLTGGLLVADLIAVPGSSRVVLGGIVAYQEAAKHALLDVPEATLRRYGAVSPQCALAMARGARHRLQAATAVSTTGVAGPGASEGKPVGTVHLAVTLRLPGREEVTAAVALDLTGTRTQIRAQAVAHGLSLLLDTLDRAGQAATEVRGGVR